ncbi:MULTISPECIES: gas vesicle protein [Streptomyces]|uniref:Gas vesicle protein n=1 Tax=Streptomyces durmitorensis TaxID=319947 RepID=A0ABY4PM78_9ACTN|nr:gas vesicle protein [Streptomyces durmitorensis]UQT54485.1 gas vesicle protein [Streptomyces durmitorensis]
MNTSPDPAKKKTTSSSQNSRNSSDEHAESGGRAKRRPGPMEVLRTARTQLAELTGMAAESVSSFEQTDDGWTLEIEVLELTRVPDTMSLLASYQVECDPQGELLGYKRVRRYERGRADSHKGGGR